MSNQVGGQPISTDQIIREIFEKYKSIAVYGMSANPDKPAHYVPAFLHEQGYRIIPINIRAAQILGRQSYRTLEEVPDRIEILEVFRPSAEALEVVQQAVARKADQGDIEAIWLQLGIKNEAARALAEEAGITFVQDRCMLVEYRRLFPGQDRDR